MARTRSPRHRTAPPQRQRQSFAAIGVLTTVTLVAIVSLLGPVYRPGRVVPIADAPADITPAVSPATEAAAASLAERPVYPYSIVAGGAASVDELKKAIDADPVVAGHYSNFDLTKARVEKLTKPQVAFVSYRMGNDIYWTRKPLVIRAGEKVLTDGVNIARTRCANQLSALPGPTSEFEPPAVTLETPVLRPLPTPLATVLPPGGGALGVPPFGTYPPTGIPIPPGVTFSAPPTGTPSHTDTPEQTPPDETPQDPPLPPPLGPPAPPPLGPPITIDDPILPPPPIGPPYDPPGDPEDPEDPPKDPPKDPPISVPEPATSVLLLIAGGACAIGRKLTTRARG